VNPDGSLVSRWRKRFACAGHGLGVVLLREPSGRVHLAALPVVGAMGIWLEINRLEWAVLALAAGGVIAAEALNTAIERLADRVSLEREEAIRLIKDLAAGGVLAATIGAVLAGLAVLGPPLWVKLLGWS
jgi:diacylglycerol kinase